jgi:hypothetical protein
VIIFEARPGRMESRRASVRVRSYFIRHYHPAGSKDVVALHYLQPAATNCSNTWTPSHTLPDLRSRCTAVQFLPRHTGKG